MERAVFDVSPDVIVHLGDHQRDSDALQKKFCRIPFLSVPGNCDYGVIDAPVLVNELDGIRFLISHGHLHGVKGSLLRFSMAAREAGARVALFGHTHVACCEEVDGVRLLNPGASGGGRPSYGVVETDGKGGVNCRIVYF